MSDISYGCGGSFLDRTKRETLRKQASHKHFLFKLASDRLNILQEQVSNYILLASWIEISWLRTSEKYQAFSNLK